MAATLASDEIDRRLDRFSKVVVQHAAMQAVLGRIKRVVRHPPRDGIPYLCGHAGTGKSQTLDVLEQDLIAESLAAMEADPGFIPVIRLNAEATNSGFGLRDFFRDSLRAVREPMIEHKIGSGKDTAYDFRDALTRALEHRKVRAFLIDEAHHIGRVGSVQVLQHNADAVKSLAEDGLLCKIDA